MAHMPVLVTLGAIIFSGTIGARIFQRLRIPQVVGYIAIGIVLGQSGFKVIDAKLIESLRPLTFFSLGIIGFLIGGELHRSVFKRHGRQLIAILLSEGLGACFINSVAVSIVVFMVVHNWPVAIGVGIILGSISSATAPAATVDVLWEYKTRGILTTTIMAIVALDDGLALILFSIASVAAGHLLGNSDAGLLQSVLHSVREVGGAVVLGTISGVVLNLMLRWIADHEKALALIVGILALTLGAAIVLEMDLIIAAMTLGAVLVNLAPNRSKKARKVMESFAPPVYVLFFVFVGARLRLHGIPSLGWVLAGVYVAGRTAGKFIGVWIGARLTNASMKIRRYLGFCLFSQAGVAIGLAIVASIRFSNYHIGNFVLGDLIVMVVAATTFLVQVIGPPFVKYAVTRAGETGLDITEEDVLKEGKVQSLADNSVPRFTENTVLAELLPKLPESDSNTYPVVNDDGRVSGIILLGDIKDYLGNPEMAKWTVAFDIMRPAIDALSPDDSLMDARNRMRELGFDSLPVIDDGRKYLGMIELRHITRYASNQIMIMNAKADAA